MLRLYRLNPKLLACTSLEEEFLYNHIPLVPLRSKVIVYNSYDKQRSQILYQHYRQLIGQAIEHYQYFKVYNPKSKVLVIAYKFHQLEDNTFMVSKVTKEEQEVRVARDLALVLKNNIK